MFSLTVKSNYAIRAILVLVENYNKQLVQIKDVVEEYNVSKNYLEQIFNTLRKSEIVKSIRGNKGGYKLACDPSQITLFDVLEVLEGKLEVDKGMNLESVSDIYKDVEQIVKEKLSVSLLEIHQRQKRHTEPVFFQI